MSEKALQIQLAFFASVATVITVGSLIYVLLTDPGSLYTSSDGVPFFTPAVQHPDTNEPVTVDELVRHMTSGE